MGFGRGSYCTYCSSPDVSGVSECESEDDSLMSGNETENSIKFIQFDALNAQDTNWRKSYLRRQNQVQDRKKNRMKRKENDAESSLRNFVGRSKVIAASGEKASHSVKLLGRQMTSLDLTIPEDESLCGDSTMCETYESSSCLIESRSDYQWLLPRVLEKEDIVDHNIISKTQDPPSVFDQEEPATMKQASEHARLLLAQAEIIGNQDAHESNNKPTAPSQTLVAAVRHLVEDRQAENALLQMRRQYAEKTSSLSSSSSLHSIPAIQVLPKRKVVASPDHSLTRSALLETKTHEDTKQSIACQVTASLNGKFVLPQKEKAKYSARARATQLLARQEQTAANLRALVALDTVQDSESSDDACETGLHFDIDAAMSSAHRSYFRIASISGQIPNGFEAHTPTILEVKEEEEEEEDDAVLQKEQKIITSRNDLISHIDRLDQVASELEEEMELSKKELDNVEKRVADEIAQLAAQNYSAILKATKHFRKPPHDTFAHDNTHPTTKIIESPVLTPINQNSPLTSSSAAENCAEIHLQSAWNAYNKLDSALKQKKSNHHSSSHQKKQQRRPPRSVRPPWRDPQGTALW